MMLSRVNSWFEKIYLFLLMAVVGGTPLVFTSYTRSVFEVNKLLLLRVVLLLGYGVWLLHYLLLKDNGIDHSEKESYTFFGFRWKRVGLEVPVSIWIFLNFLSTIFSQSIHIGIIGAYDRWEGILTILNYVGLLYLFAKLLTKKWQFHWLVGGFLVSTGLSAVYGVFQSLGFDVMNWSADPTSRVFACINNPVHYCAYVAMIVPLGIGYLLHYAKKHHTEETIPIHQKTDHLFFKVFRIGVFIGALLLLFKTVFMDSALYFSFFQMSLLLGLGWYLCMTTPFILTDRQSALRWSFYSFLVLFAIFAPGFEFTRHQWVGFFLSFGSFFVISPLPRIHNALKRLIFILILVIFYTQILSFSRATWVGFSLFMPLFYLLSLRQLTALNFRRFLFDVALTTLLIGVYSLQFTFNLYQRGVVLGGLVFLVLGCLLALLYFLKPKVKIEFPLRNKVLFSVGILILGIFLFAVSTPETIVSLSIVKMFLLLGFLWIVTQIKGRERAVFQHIVPIMIFALLQQVGVSLLHALIYLSLVAAFYYLSLRSNNTVSREQKFWLLGILLSFGAIVMLPVFPAFFTAIFDFVQDHSLYALLGLSTLGCLVLLLNVEVFNGLNPFTKRRVMISGVILLLQCGVVSFGYFSLLEKKTVEVQELNVAHNIKGRAQIVKNELERSARISMWRSSIPWMLDYPFLGSGLDTIKFMYPVYRESIYGILEGGHNFTPDRLHNEYLNTLVSKGFPSTILYYFGVVLGWFYLMCRFLYNKQDNGFSFIVIALMTGVGIYLGQVIFNFGVVATLVLFYELMGMGLAMVSMKDFDDE